MVEKLKKKNRIFDYFQLKEEQYAGGLSWCAGCPLELALRAVPKVLGKNIVVVGCPCCSAPILYGQNVGTWHKMTYYSTLMTGVASSATGISRYYQKTGNDATVVCWVGDGCAADIGFQQLSGAAERNEKMLYICYDNEGYMNTGIQRSGTTPLGASTTTTPVGKVGRGKPTNSKNLPIIMLMHEPVYMATATLSHLEDFFKKLQKGQKAAKEGFAYMHVFCPCPTGWRIETDMSIEVCRAAVRTNYFPLWEAEYGKPRITVEVATPKPVTELTKLIRKFSHLKENELAALQKEVDSRYALLKILCDAAKVEKAA